MRTYLMTEEEMLYRYKPWRAWELSVEKWKRAILAKNWPKIQDSPYTYLDGASCACCKRHSYDLSCVGETLDDVCPLVDTIKADGDAFGCSKRSPWDRAMDAADEGNRKKFVCAAKRIITILERAIANKKKKDNHEPKNK